MVSEDVYSMTVAVTVLAMKVCSRCERGEVLQVTERRAWSYEYFGRLLTHCSCYTPGSLRSENGYGICVRSLSPHMFVAIAPDPSRDSLIKKKTARINSINYK